MSIIHRLNCRSQRLRTYSRRTRKLNRQLLAAMKKAALIRAGSSIKVEMKTVLANGGRGKKGSTDERRSTVWFEPDVLAPTIPENES